MTDDTYTQDIAREMHSAHAALSHRPKSLYGVAEENMTADESRALYEIQGDLHLARYKAFYPLAQRQPTEYEHRRDYRQRLTSAAKQYREIKAWAPPPSWAAQVNAGEMLAALKALNARRAEVLVRTSPGALTLIWKDKRENVSAIVDGTGEIRVSWVALLDYVATFPKGEQISLGIEPRQRVVPLMPKLARTQQTIGAAFTVTSQDMRYIARFAEQKPTWEEERASEDDEIEALRIPADVSAAWIKALPSMAKSMRLWDGQHGAHVLMSVKDSMLTIALADGDQVRAMRAFSPSDDLTLAFYLDKFTLAELRKAHGEIRVMLPAEAGIILLRHAGGMVRCAKRVPTLRILDFAPGADSTPYLGDGRMAVKRSKAKQINLSASPIGKLVLGTCEQEIGDTSEELDDLYCSAPGAQVKASVNREYWNASLAFLGKSFHWSGIPAGEVKHLTLAGDGRWVALMPMAIVDTQVPEVIAQKYASAAPEVPGAPASPSVPKSSAFQRSQPAEPDGARLLDYCENEQMRQWLIADFAVLRWIDTTPGARLARWPRWHVYSPNGLNAPLQCGATLHDLGYIVCDVSGNYHARIPSAIIPAPVRPPLPRRGPARLSKSAHASAARAAYTEAWRGIRTIARAGSAEQLRIALAQTDTPAWRAACHTWRTAPACIGYNVRLEIRRRREVRELEHQREVQRAIESASAPKLPSAPTMYQAGPRTFETFEEAADYGSRADFPVCVVHGDYVSVHDI